MNAFQATYGGGIDDAIVMKIGAPAFFNTQVPLSNGVFYMGLSDGMLFGYYAYESNTILYHFDMGYEYVSPSSGTSLYFYDFVSGHWWYTSAALFPNLYDFSIGSWIYYFPDTKNPGITPPIRAISRT